MKTTLLCTLVVLLQVHSLVANSPGSCPVFPGLPGRDGMPAFAQYVLKTVANGHKFGQMLQTYDFYTIIADIALLVFIAYMCNLATIGNAVPHH